MSAICRTTSFLPASSQKFFQGKMLQRSFSTLEDLIGSLPKVEGEEEKLKIIERTFFGRRFYLVGETHDTQNSRMYEFRLRKSAYEKTSAYFREDIDYPPHLDELLGEETFRFYARGGYNFSLENREFCFLTRLVLAHFNLSTYLYLFNAVPITLSRQVIHLAHYPEMHASWNGLAKFTQDRETDSYYSIFQQKLFRNFSLNLDAPLGLNYFTSSEVQQVARLSKIVAKNINQLNPKNFDDYKSKISLIELDCQAPSIQESMHYFNMLACHALALIHEQNPLPKEVIRATNLTLMKRAFNTLKMDAFIKTCCLHARNEIFVNNIIEALPNIPQDLPVIAQVGWKHLEGMVKLLEQAESAKKPPQFLLSSKWIPALHRSFPQNL